MADPQKYTRDYSFTDYQASNPSAPLPGLQVDNELEDVEASIGEIVDAIKDVRRSDGALKNGIVTVDSLSPAVAAGIGTGSLTAQEAAEAAAAAASDSADAAAASATSASGSATSASGYALNALTSRNEASGFANDSAAAASLAQTARDYAYQWSSAASGADVNDGVNPVNKSAYHWAQVALAAAAGTIADGSVTTAKLADGALSADTTGRAKMADGYLTAAKLDTAAPIVRYDTVQSFTVAQQGQARANIDASALAGSRNRIINGAGAVSQRTYTTVADDSYWCDRHYILSQTAVITPTIITDVTDGLPFMMRLTQSQATAQRMGNAQILEAYTSKELRGSTVTLGGKMRCSSSKAIRYAVLEWTGTADAVTSDVVNNWASAIFTAGNFFLASNITVAATGSITPAANTLTDWSLIAGISSSCNNIIVIMWTEGTAAQNVTLDHVWGLVPGNAAAEAWPYDHRNLQQETALCQRYYYTGTFSITGLCASGATLQSWRNHPVEMRDVPTVSLGSATATNITGIVTTGTTTKAVGAAGTGTTGTPTNSVFSAPYVANAEL